MVHLTYIQNSGGRSGHALGDVTTAFILEKLLKEFNLALVFHASWLNQKVITPESLKAHCVEPLTVYDHIVEINHKTFPLPFVEGAGGDQSHWLGWSWDDFIRLKDLLTGLDPFNKNILIKASYGCKIHLNSVKGWYLNGLLTEDIYKKTTTLLKNLYYRDHPQGTIKGIAIHIRTGDLMYRYHQDLGYEYYANIIHCLNRSVNYPINVYFENLNAEDYLKLGDLPNTTVYPAGKPSQKQRAGDKNLERDINMLIRHEVLFVSPCSLAIFCGQLSNGLVLCDASLITSHRRKLFKEAGNVFEVFNSIEDKLETIKKTFLK